MVTFRARRSPYASCFLIKVRWGVIAFCRLFSLFHFSGHRRIIEQWGAAKDIGIIAARVLSVLTKSN
jgi:hypothetical protein